MLASSRRNHAVSLARSGHNVASAPLDCAEVIAAGMKLRRQVEVGLQNLSERPTASELRGHGLKLHSLAMTNQGVFDVYSSLGALPASLELVIDHSELAHLPWEYLQDPKMPPGPNSTRPPVRVVPTVGAPPVQPRPLSEGLRVLFCSSEPKRQRTTNWAEAAFRIQHLLESQVDHEDFSLRTIQGTSKRALRDAVRRTDVDILHFYGHGTVNKEGEGCLLLEGRGGAVDSYPASSFANMVSGSGIQLVVLTACHTSEGDFSREFGVIAEALVLAGVPAVVANQFALVDINASFFTGALYSQLLSSGDVDLAFAEGRLALYDELTTEAQVSLEWGIPTLYRREGARQLFEVSK